MTEPHEVPDPHVRRRLVDQARAIGQHPRGWAGVWRAGRPAHRRGAARRGRWRRPGVPSRFIAHSRTLADHGRGAGHRARRHPAVDQRAVRRGQLAAGRSGPCGWGRGACSAGAGLQLLPGGGITGQALTALSRVPGLREVHVGRLVREPATVGRRGVGRSGRGAGRRTCDSFGHPPEQQGSSGARVGSSLYFGRRAFAPAQFDTGLQRRRRPADERDIMEMQSIALLILAGIALTLYIMRRRSRQGKRTPKF